MINESIKCDVCSCKHNREGRNCELAQIKITTDCTDCTCCENYCFKEDLY